MKTTNKALKLYDYRKCLKFLKGNKIYSYFLYKYNTLNLPIGFIS